MRTSLNHSEPLGAARFFLTMVSSNFAGCLATASFSTLSTCLLFGYCCSGYHDALRDRRSSLPLVAAILIVGSSAILLSASDLSKKRNSALLTNVREYCESVRCLLLQIGRSVTSYHTLINSSLSMSTVLERILPKSSIIVSGCAFPRLVLPYCHP